MKKAFIFIAWTFFTSLFFIGVVTYSYSFTQKPLATLTLSHFTNQPDKTIYAIGTSTGQVKGLTTSIKTADARPVIISEFLEKNNAPLKPYDYWGDFLTKLADKYKLDFRLLPSIMMQESNLCKKIPDNTFNCLGLGIHSRGTWGFKSFEENFDAAASILRKNYLDKGYETPEEIQMKYTPKSNGSWQHAVNYFMDVLEKADF
jgi:hypothetical protein